MVKIIEFDESPELPKTETQEFDIRLLDVTGAGFLGPELVNAALNAAHERNIPAKEILRAWAEAGQQAAE